MCLIRKALFNLNHSTALVSKVSRPNIFVECGVLWSHSLFLLYSYRIVLQISLYMQDTTIFIKHISWDLKYKGSQIYVCNYMIQLLLLNRFWAVITLYQWLYYQILKWILRIVKAGKAACVWNILGSHTFPCKFLLSSTTGY